MTETDIVKGCVRQDRNSQKFLYEMFYSKMMGACLRYGKDKDQAKDVLQDAFIKVFTNIKSFTGSGSLEGWIRRIVVNTAIDYLRKNKQEWGVVSTVHAYQKADEYKEEDTTDEDLINDISKEDIIKAVQQLSPAYRAVFSMFVLDEYSHKEIAEALDISEGTSKSNLAKAKFNLRKNLTHLIKKTTS